MKSIEKFNMIDFKRKPIFGMIHLSGVSPVNRAMSEIFTYCDCGVDGIIIENYHSDSATVELVLKEIKRLYTDHDEYLSTKTPNGQSQLLIGINILPNNFEQSLTMANKYQCDFIQLDHVAGKYTRGVALDEEAYIACRAKYPHIAVLGGVWPKYYQPVADSSLIADIKVGAKRADAIVVTGSGTGSETPIKKIMDFKHHLNIIFNTTGKQVPLVIGAGLDPNNVKEQLKYADGAIVGSTFKNGKNTSLEVNLELVQEFMHAKHAAV